MLFKLVNQSNIINSKNIIYDAHRIQKQLQESLQLQQTVRAELNCIRSYQYFLSVIQLQMHRFLYTSFNFACNSLSLMFCCKKTKTQNNEIYRSTKTTEKKRIKNSLAFPESLWEGPSYILVAFLSKLIFINN